MYIPFFYLARPQIHCLLSPPGLIPLRVGQARVQNRGLILDGVRKSGIVYSAVPAMPLEAGVADVRELETRSNDGFLDHCTGEACRPGLVDSTVPVGRGVEGVVHHEVELAVGEGGLHVTVVGVLCPGGVREVQDQGVLGSGLGSPVAAEEGWEAGEVQIHHCER